MFFQGKISAIFTLLKGFLEILTLDEGEQQDHFREMIKKYPEDSVDLILQISRNLNPLLAKSIRQVQFGTSKKRARKPKYPPKQDAEPAILADSQPRAKSRYTSTPKEKSSDKFMLFSD
jgi:hypothetical protein